METSTEEKVFHYKGLYIHPPDRDCMCFVDACGEYEWSIPFEELKKFILSQEVVNDNE